MCQKLYCSLRDPNSNVGLKSLSICRAGDKNKQAIENGDSGQFLENGTMMPKRLAPIVHLANSKKTALEDHLVTSALVSLPTINPSKTQLSAFSGSE